MMVIDAGTSDWRTMPALGEKHHLRDQKNPEIRDFCGFLGVTDAFRMAKKCKSKKGLFCTPYLTPHP